MRWSTRKDVERLREPIEKHFVAALVGHIDRLGSPMDALQEPDGEVSGSELSLVESGEFADWLAWKNIYSRADALFKLDRRFGELVGVSSAEENNPVDLAVLCHTFHNVVQTITTPRVARRFIFEAFDDTVVADPQTFYVDLNTLLESRGILPGRTPKTVGRGIVR